MTYMFISPWRYSRLLLWRQFITGVFKLKLLRCGVRVQDFELETVQPGQAWSEVWSSRVPSTSTVPGTILDSRYWYLVSQQARPSAGSRAGKKFLEKFQCLSVRVRVLRQTYLSIYLCLDAGTPYRY